MIAIFTHIKDTHTGRHQFRFECSERERPWKSNSMIRNGMNARIEVTLAPKITKGIYKLFQIVLGRIVWEEFKHVYFYFHNYVSIAFVTFCSNTPSNTQSVEIWHKDWYKCFSKWMKGRKKMKKRKKIERNCLCLCIYST